MVTVKCAINRKLASPASCGHREAFTLVELILVMAMLLIVMAVAAPSLTRFFRGRSLDSEARRFVSLTRYGQSRAVSEGVPMIMWIDTDQRRYGLTEEYNYTDRDAKAVEYELGKDLIVEVENSAMVGRQTVPVGLTAQNQSFGRNAMTIRFLPDGFMSESSPTNLWIREGERQTGARDASERDEIWITLSRNRLTYEIQTNNLPYVRR